jgi:hypothetical protein
VYVLKNVIQLEISKNENSRKIREIILTKREIKITDKNATENNNNKN